ncbi:MULTISPECIES: ABZJ_00895 family protein [unclassified Psychrobacter]|uniref:ABZJ_00895 family protein n=2 Tax=Psychrobacter TaxID=497 RepID=UPI003FD1A394
MTDQRPNLQKPVPLAYQNAINSSANMTEYVGFFAVGYILASVVFIVMQTQLVMNPHLVTVLSVIAAAYIAVYKFIKHHKRALQRSEMNRLTLAGTATVWLLSTLYFLGIWFALFDVVSREVFTEMAIENPMPLVSAVIMIMLLTLISARISILIFNRLLTPK